MGSAVTFIQGGFRLRLRSSRCLEHNCQDSLLKAPDPALATLSLERVFNGLLHTRTQHSNLEPMLCAEVLFLARALLIIQLVERGCVYSCLSPRTGGPCEGEVLTPSHAPTQLSRPPKGLVYSRCVITLQQTQWRFTALMECLYAPNPYVKPYLPTRLYFEMGPGRR